MKMTVIATRDGKLVAASFGHTAYPNYLEGPGPDLGWRASVFAGPGQELHLLDVPDEVAALASSQEFHSKIEGELRKVRR